MAGLGPHSGDGDVLIVATDHVAGSRLLCPHHV